MTLGQYVFAADYALPSNRPPLWLQSHEYIHTLQYQGRALDFIDYKNNPTGGTATNLEQLGYLWGAWTRAYGVWEQEPWQIWKPL